MVPLVMAVLWYRDIIPGPLALAFSISDFGGFLWTLSAWKAEEARAGRDAEPIGAGIASDVFGFTSGVIRNARTFHPDGRMVRGTVHSLQPQDAALAKAAEQLAGSAALMRLGMGVMKTGMPNWLANLVPDAPSIAARFFSPSEVEVPLQRRPRGGPRPALYRGPLFRHGLYRAGRNQRTGAKRTWSWLERQRQACLD